MGIYDGVIIAGSGWGSGLIGLTGFTGSIGVSGGVGIGSGTGEGLGTGIGSGTVTLVVGLKPFILAPYPSFLFPNPI